MIIGIGTDIVEIERIKKACAKQAFLREYFSPNENEFFSAKKDCVQSVAANFAAKEAFVKALGTGFADSVALKDIEVLRNPAGKPYILFGREGWDKKIHVSLSHCGAYATAFVVIEE